MGAGQSDLYKGTYGDNIENIPDELKDKKDASNRKVTLPQNDSQTKHIFRRDAGHLPDTKENRKMIEDLANDSKHYNGQDKWGNDWNTRTNKDGTQDWVRHRNGKINDGGKNETALPWNADTGLFKNVVRRH